MRSVEAKLAKLAANGGDGADDPWAAAAATTIGRAGADDLGSLALVVHEVRRETSRRLPNDDLRSVYTILRTQGYAACLTPMDGDAAAGAPPGTAAPPLRLVTPGSSTFGPLTVDDISNLSHPGSARPASTGRRGGGQPGNRAAGARRARRGGGRRGGGGGGSVRTAGPAITVAQRRKLVREDKLAKAQRAIEKRKAEEKQIRATALAKATMRTATRKKRAAAAIERSKHRFWGAGKVKATSAHLTESRHRSGD